MRFCKKIGFQLSIAFLIIGFGVSTTLACTCVQDSLEKRFRKAKAIFIGKAIDKEPDNKSLIQNISNDTRFSQVVEVVKGFKGTKKQFININLDTTGLVDSGNCPTLYYLEKDKEYLVFAYGENLNVIIVCPDTWVIPRDKENFGYEQMQDYIKKLSSFWFRFRARLNPF